MAFPSSPDSPLDAWHVLLQVSSRVVTELDRRLDLEHRMSVREFDVLINLDTAAQESLRMTDLASAVLLSSGGLTRLVGRLEDRGLIQRLPDPTDGRGYLASLTDSGRARLADARATHDAVVRDALAPLSGIELDSVRRALAKALTARSPR